MLIFLDYKVPQTSLAVDVEHEEEHELKNLQHRFDLSFGVQGTDKPL